MRAFQLPSFPCWSRMFSNFVQNSVFHLSHTVFCLPRSATTNAEDRLCLRRQWMPEIFSAFWNTATSCAHVKKMSLRLEHHMRVEMWCTYEPPSRRCAFWLCLAQTHIATQSRRAKSGLSYRGEGVLVRTLQCGHGRCLFCPRAHIRNHRGPSKSTKCPRIYSSAKLFFLVQRTRRWTSAMFFRNIVCRPSVFWNATRRRLVFGYRCLGLFDPWRWNRCVVPKRR
jgi:hypothetical protein